MSENIYDILARLPKDNAPVVSPIDAEPLYESVEPLDSVNDTVRILQEKFSKYNYDDQESKYLNPQAKRFVQLAKAKFPETSSDLEAVVASIGDKTEELDQRDRDTAEWIAKAKATIGQQQREIEQTEQAVVDANARYDAQEKRFQEFNRQVAAAELDVQQQAQAALDYAKQPHAEPQAIISKVQAQQPTEPMAEPVAAAPAEEPTAQPVPVEPAPTPAPTPEPVAVEPPPTNVVDIKPKKSGGKISKGVKQDVESLWGKAAESKIQKKKVLEQENLAASIADKNWEIIQNNRLVPPQSTNLEFGDKILPLKPLAVQALWTYFMRKSTKNIGKPDQTTDKVMLTNLVRSTLNNPITVTYLLGTKEILGYESYLKSLQTKLRKAKQISMDLDRPEQPAQQPQQQGLANTQFGKYIQQKATEPPAQGDLFGNPSMSENINKIAKNLMERFMNFKESAKPDFLDLDKDGDTEEPMKSAAKDAKEHEPAKPDADAVAKRKRLQALKDKQEDDRAERGDYDSKSSSRFVKGHAYGGSAQKDDEEKDLDESGGPYELYNPKHPKFAANYKKYKAKHPDCKLADFIAAMKKQEHGVSEASYSAKAARAGKDIGKPGKAFAKIAKSAGERYGSKERGEKVAGAVLAKLRHGEELDEVAPPGAKAERMVKHIKKAYSKDGKLTPKEKSIAYATTWKAHNKGQVEEGTKFGDTIKNSEAKMTKSKVKVTEGKEAIRNHPIYTDKNAWDHYKKELDEQEAMDEMVNPTPAVLNVEQELDEIAALAGLPKKESSCMECGMLESACSCSHEEDLDEVAPPPKYVPDPNKPKAVPGKFEQPATPAGQSFPSAPVRVGEEEEMGEGNEFSGALAKAKAAGEKEFEVDGKKYTVKEDVNVNLSATGEEDVVKLIQKLAGMPVVAVAQHLEPEVHAVEVAEDGPKERDVEYTNSPREEVAGTNAAIPSGTDLNRAKKSYSDKPFRGDNPMAVAEAKEEQLWKAYESMINDIKA